MSRPKAAASRQTEFQLKAAAFLPTAAVSRQVAAGSQLKASASLPTAPELQGAESRLRVPARRVQVEFQPKGPVRVSPEPEFQLTGLVVRVESQPLALEPAPEAEFRPKELAPVLVLPEMEFQPMALGRLVVESWPKELVTVPPEAVSRLMAQALPEQEPPVSVLAQRRHLNSAAAVGCRSSCAGKR